MAYEDTEAPKVDKHPEGCIFIVVCTEPTRNTRKCTSSYCYHPLPRRGKVDWIPLVSIFEINLNLHH